MNTSPPTEIEVAEHVAEIAAQIEQLRDYGPIRITTRVPDIPGAEYHEVLLASAPDQRPIARIGSGAVSPRVVLLGEGSFTEVRIHYSGFGDAIPLPFADIEKVEVEHPFGHSMPLHGRSVPTTEINTRTGVPWLRWPDHFIEYGMHDRLEATIHPQYPGVGVIRAYQADEYDKQLKPVAAPTLEEAKEAAVHCRIFLVSRVDDDFAVITSRIGYDNGSPVMVRHPRHDHGMRHMVVDMLDFAGDTGEEALLEAHVERLKKAWYGNGFGDPLKPITQLQVDEIYCYATHD